MPDIPNSPVDLNFDAITNDVTRVLSDIEWRTWGVAVLFVVLGFIFAGFASRLIGRALATHTSAHYTQIIRRLLYYGILIISLIFALSALQLNLQVLGIATILTLAIGFAAQTAVSNIISGLFLIFERPFSVGDQIDYNGVIGELLAIDLLSIKIRTHDNSLVRIPNEMLLKNQFINLTRFPQRRLEIKLYISLSEDLKNIRKILLNLAHKNPLILKEPAANLLFEEFTDSLIVFCLAVWVNTKDHDPLKHALTFDIQQVLKEHGIKTPVMHVALEPQPES